MQPNDDTRTRASKSDVMSAVRDCAALMTEAAAAEKAGYGVTGIRADLDVIAADFGHRSPMTVARLRELRAAMRKSQAKLREVTAVPLSTPEPVDPHAPWRRPAGYPAPPPTPPSGTGPRQPTRGSSQEVELWQHRRGDVERY